MSKIRKISSNPRKIYIGVAWPYVNDVFHLGNLAGAYLPPDIFSRFHKLSGNKVMMVSGSDYHGTPTTIKAEKEGVSPIEIANRYHKLDVEYLKRFRIEYSLYTSTHTKNHFAVTQEMFLRLMKNGYIKILKTKQLYSLVSGKFLQDRYIEGECPYCHDKGARGDQCEKCGRVLDALELVNPISKVDKSPLIPKETENYFLDLKKLQKEIKKWLISRKNWRPWVKQEALGWVNEGLKPRAITRDLNYGIPLPINKIPKSQQIENIKEKVFYVWFEAVIGYCSAAIEYSKKIKRPNEWKEYFFKKDGETYYFVGQDNLVFHTINWPAQLMAYDKKINLPVNVFVNKFLLLEGEKMSKSRGWYLSNEELLNSYTSDSLRFYLSLNMPESKEFSFNWADFIGTNNNVLVAKIGNLIHRVLTITKNNFGNEINLNMTISKVVRMRIEKTFKYTSINIDKGNFKESLQEIVELATYGNQLFDKYQPWKLVKTDKKKAMVAITDYLAIIANLRTLIYPFLPNTGEQLSVLLGLPGITTKPGQSQWEYKIPKKIIIAKDFKPLFVKIPEETIEIELNRLRRE